MPILTMKKDRNAQKKAKSRIKAIKTKIKPLYLKYRQTIATSTLYAWELGLILNKLKNLCLDAGLSWERYRLSNFPYIHERKAQRFMKLAREINLEDYPALTVISINKIDVFITHCKGTEVAPADILSSFFKSINLADKVPNTVEEIQDFKKLFETTIEGISLDPMSWLDQNDGGKDYETQMKQNRKQNRALGDYQRKQLKRQGKIHSETLSRSINRGTNSLNKSFDWILNNRENIVAREGLMESLNHNSIIDLFNSIEEFTRYKNKCHRPNRALPTDDDI